MTSQEDPSGEKDIQPPESPESSKPTLVRNLPLTQIPNDETPPLGLESLPKDGQLDFTANSTANSIGETLSESQTQQGPVHSVFTVKQKRSIILVASFAAFFSPLSSSIYFPSLDTIAHDLHESPSKISLTVTTYLIVQGLAPMMIAGFSDSAGRRPAYIICFIIYIAANLGLSLQNSYAGLLVLRCIQSGGSSGTVALANGIVGDLVTSEDRGKYIAFASLGSMLGPSVSPIIGGLISQYLDWHWIFWFLLILSCSFFLPLLLFMPETCRRVVGNGSIPPPKLNMSLTDYLRHRKRTKAGITVDITQQQELRKNYGVRFPNPLSTIAVVTQKESGILLFTTGLGLVCYYAISTAASKQFSSNYHFNVLEVGLIFLPLGAGSVLSAFTTGKMVDANYRRLAKIHGLPLKMNRQQDLSNFPIEKARLQIGFPMMWIGGLSVLAYGWIMDRHVSIAGPIVILFIMGYSLIAMSQVLNILMVDIYPGKPATATAANNLVRCELGAAASAAIVPMIDAIGSGWSFTLLSLLFLVCTPTLYLLIIYGIEWRQKQKARRDERAIRKEDIQETEEKK